MKKNIFRILAFVIDMFVINIILILLSTISFINNSKVELGDEIKEYNEVKLEYDKLSKRIDEMLFDNYIDLSENNEIKSDYPYYKSAFYGVPVNSQFDSEMKNKIKDEIENIYLNKHYSYTYDINKANRKVNIIGVFLSLFYFGIIEWLFNGKTLGKRIFRLRTVDNDEIKNNLPFWKYIVRSLFVSETVFYLFNILFVSICHEGFEGTLNVMWYSKANSILYSIQYIYLVAMLLTMIIRIDNRSIHDIVLNTRVALFDKKNKEVIEIKDEEVDN